MNNIKKGGVQHPFQTYDSQFKSDLAKPYEPFTASAVSGKEDQIKRAEISGQNPQAVSLPPHLFIPEGAQSIDIRNLANVPAGDTVTLLEFQCPQGGYVTFINYSVFFDALLFNLVNLVPLVNGQRVFPYHGNPQQNYKIGLGTGPDLSNANLISCQLYLQPKDIVQWVFTNNDTVDVAAGVRMVGYLDKRTLRDAKRFGG